MCKFKSGIILKEKCYIGDKDHHSDMLSELGIEDNYIGASKTFVRAELVPIDNKWWEDPDSWTFIVDQDIVPEWFTEDKENQEERFRAAVKAWWEVHVLVDKKIEELSSSSYRLKRCEVKRLINDVQVVCDSSTIQEMYNSSTVQKMYDNSTVKKMYDRSTVQKMYNNSTVQEMYNNSTVQEMYSNSTVQEMYRNSTVREMYDRSIVQKMRDNSTVQKMRDNSTVQAMRGNSIASNYTNKKIYISGETDFKVEVLENEKK